jgi:uncharacterized protein
MKSHTSNAPWTPERLDVRSLAQAAGQVKGQEGLQRFPRLTEELLEPGSPPVAVEVQWQAAGEMRAASQGGQAEVWLHLEASTTLPIQCQRCLGPVDTPLAVDRWYRFVADEATAEAQDDESEEDVLALEPRMSLIQLIEDELLMELPLVPMHETCPVPVVMQALDPAVDTAQAEAQRENPFAALARLKK